MKNSIVGNLFSNTKEYSVAKSSEKIQENSMFTKKRVVRAALLVVGAYTPVSYTHLTLPTKLEV